MLLKLTFAAVVPVLAIATPLNKRQGENPFAGVPNLRSFGVCPTRCAPVFSVQENPPADFSTLCTPTFAGQLNYCLDCMAGNVPAVFLNDDIRRQIDAAVTAYETGCSPVDVTVPVVFQPPVTITTTSGTSTFTTTIPASEAVGGPSTSTLTSTTTETSTTTAPSSISTSVSVSVTTTTSSSVSSATTTSTSVTTTTSASETATTTTTTESATATGEGSNARSLSLDIKPVLALILGSGMLVISF